MFLLPFFGNKTHICMNIEFRTNKLKKQLSIPAEIKKAFGTNAKKVTQRMDDMQAASNLEILCKISAANCHPLTGDRNGEWAVDISANHRIIFTIDHEPIQMKEDGGINRILVTDIVITAAGEDYH